MRIDIAMSFSADNHICFLSHNFFQEINSKPNYFLFFNKNMANSHGSNIKFKKGILISESRLVEKNNFYSTVEDLLKTARKYKHLPLSKF